MQIVDESNTDELQLEMGDLKLIIKRRDTRTEVEKSVKAPETETIKPQMAQESLQTAQPQPSRSQVSAVDETEGLMPIRAPMLGIFYNAPKPGAPPFVEVGQVISEEETVCIIEVMKLFCSVKAGIRGRIAKICVENGDMVEFNQNLFLLEKTIADKAAAGEEQVR